MPYSGSPIFNVSTHDKTFTLFTGLHWGKQYWLMSASYRLRKNQVPAGTLFLNEY